MPWAAGATRAARIYLACLRNSHVALKIGQYYKKWKEGRLAPPNEVRLPFWSGQKATYHKLLEDLE